MDTVMPEGFFGNTREIYAEIASYPVVPPEKIKQYWNVYTTTFRRLFDPSAFRLENFWWHVWGSERLRNLSGAALARLFEEFSNGPTFVPLSPTRFKALGQGRLGNHGRGSEPTHPLHHASGQGSAPSASSKGPTPSSSRPAPSHSILKKSRGPSASGPRPTARFASPPASYEEGIAVSEDVNTRTAVAASGMPPPPLPVSARQQQAISPSTPAKSHLAPTAESTVSASNPAVSGTEMRPPPSVSPARGEKTTTNAGRRIVVATAASRRRPVMVRRPSSQSSAGSDTGTRVVGFVAASKRSGSKKANQTASQLLGQGSSSQGSDAGISAKAAGKRPAKAPTGKRSTSRSLPTQTDNHADEPVTTQQVRPASPQRRSTWDVKDSVASQVASQTQQSVVQQSLPAQVPPPVAGFVADQTVRHRAPPMVRSRSNNSEHGVALLPSQATSSVATFITTARGQFDSETVTTEPVVPEPRDIPDQVRFGSQASSSVLDLQFRPTPPNPAPPIPFGRSRSELALLLRRGNSSRGEAD